MACRALKSMNIRRFTNPTELLRELQLQIDDLREIAKETDFDDPNDTKQFMNNVNYIKNYFETYNRLLERNE